MVRTVTNYIRAMGVRAVNESNALRTQKLEHEAEKSWVFLHSNASQAGAQMTDCGLLVHYRESWPPDYIKQRRCDDLPRDTDRWHGVWCYQSG